MWVYVLSSRARCKASLVYDEMGSAPNSDKAPHVDYDIELGPELAQSLADRFERIVNTKAVDVTPKALLAEKKSGDSDNDRKRILIPRKKNSNSE